MPTEPDAVRDQRGAVMVGAVFMAAFLVGVLWYVIGIGDAAVYRETMQDGADATAFAAAVYHARGMNVIAMLNLIMAAVLAVLVALKIAQILLITTNVISCALAWTGVGAAVCSATSSAEEPMQQMIDTTEKIVDKVLRGLNVASTGVAVGMPWVAEAKAAAVAHEYGTTVHGGLMMSASLAPAVDLNVGGSAGAPGSVFEHGALSGGSGGTRLGLPVQEDDFTVLCGHAGHGVMDIVLAPFDAFGVPTEWAKGFVQNLVETFPGYFCGGSGGAAPGGLVDQTAAEICKRTKDEIDKYNLTHTKKKPFDNDKCLADATKGAKSGLGKNVGAGGPMQGGTAGKTPKRVYDGAKNGDDYFAIWSFAWGDLKSQSNAQRGVDIAAWNQRKTRDPSVLSKSAFAKAEFYYDVVGSGGKRPAWGDYKDDAMWNLRWRARMRRVKSPGSALGNLVGAKLGGHLGEYMGGFLGDSSAAHAALDWMTAWPANVADGIDDATRDAIGTSARDNGYFTVIH